MMAFTSPEDMMKNLPKAMGNLSKALGVGGPPTDSTTFKIGMREYEEMAVKEGDQISIENKEIRQQQWEIDIETRMIRLIPLF
jgi:hypothetical protein